MSKKIKSVTVIGDGGWGTALSVMLSRKKTKVTLWGAFPENLKAIRRNKENKKFLPGIKVPAAVNLEMDLCTALSAGTLVILAVPAEYMRAAVRKIKKHGWEKNVCFLSVAKGLENRTTLRMSEVIFEELGGVDLSVLSGPNIAYEVACGIPSAAVCAGKNKKTAARIQDLLMMPEFRVYTSADMVGVELGGAFKNIIAIACGICDGLGFGTNTKAALLTRGLAEITRLAVSLGAQEKTLYGLSGIGDLVTTCMSRRSRNRWLGENLGKGLKLKAILAKTGMVVEGVNTARTALKLSRKKGISMPITAEVNKVLFQGKSPGAAMSALMNRAKRSED